MYELQQPAQDCDEDVEKETSVENNQALEEPTDRENITGRDYEEVDDDPDVGHEEVYQA